MKLATPETARHTVAGATSPYALPPTPARRTLHAFLQRVPDGDAHIESYMKKAMAPPDLDGSNARQRGTWLHLCKAYPYPAAKDKLKAEVAASDGDFSAADRCAYRCTLL